MEFDIWKLLAGLGIFMFGIFLMEESIKQLAGKAFKRWIKRATKTRLKAIFTGIGSTAILQSSSAVSLMTLALAGAGVIGMENAIGVVMGTNVGTTFTGWIVATLGFKVSVEKLALPMIGIGGLGLIFLSRSPRFSGISKLLVGFGFLFMGLDYMKVSVESFSNTIDIAALPVYGIWFYVLLGFVLTGVMQSSSATLAIILTTLDAGILQFSQGAGMVVGANMGTTVTIMLGAIGAVQSKKQIAVSHFLFNFITAFAALALLPGFVFVLDLLQEDNYSDVMGIALFHTFFNVLGVLIFFPFVPRLVGLLKRIFPDKKSENTLFIHNVTVDLPEASVHALRLETQHFYSMVLILLEWVMGIRKRNNSFTQSYKWYHEYMKKHVDDGVEEYNVNLKSLQAGIATYAVSVRQNELEADDIAKLHQVIHSAIALLQAIKLIEVVRDEWENLKQSDTPDVKILLERIENRIANYLHHFKTSELEGAPHLHLDLPASEMMGVIEHDYDKFISTISAHLSNKMIENRHATALLTLNGLLTQVFRQMLHVFPQLRSNKNYDAEAAGF